MGEETYTVSGNGRHGLPPPPPGGRAISSRQVPIVKGLTCHAPRHSTTSSRRPLAAQGKRTRPPVSERRPSGGEWRSLPCPCMRRWSRGSHAATRPRSPGVGGRVSRVAALIGANSCSSVRRRSRRFGPPDGARVTMDVEVEVHPVPRVGPLAQIEPAPGTDRVVSASKWLPRTVSRKYVFDTIWNTAIVAESERLRPPRNSCRAPLGPHPRRRRPGWGPPGNTAVSPGP